MSDLADWSGAACPDDAVIHGCRVRLEPLGPEHVAGLWAEVAAAASGDDPRLWDYLPYGPFADEQQFTAWCTDQVTSADPRFYAVVPQPRGTPAGMLALMACVPDHGSIEIGHVWFGPSLQRTPEATDAVYAAAGHAFGALGHRRVEWKCNAENARSTAAAERLGFRYEGTFRRHMVVKGRNRDTAWFSITDAEWPAILGAYTEWRAPENQDAAGHQLRSLASFRAE